MKQYKVETLVFYSKVTLDKEHLAKASSKEIQEKLDEYTSNGWSLASTNVTGFGSAIYVYLYFEKEDMINVTLLDNS